MIYLLIGCIITTSLMIWGWIYEIKNGNVRDFPIGALCGILFGALSFVLWLLFVTLPYCNK